MTDKLNDLITDMIVRYPGADTKLLAKETYDRILPAELDGWVLELLEGRVKDVLNSRRNAAMKTATSPEAQAEIVDGDDDDDDEYDDDIDSEDDDDIDSDDEDTDDDDSAAPSYGAAHAPFTATVKVPKPETQDGAPAAKAGETTPTGTKPKAPRGMGKVPHSARITKAAREWARWKEDEIFVGKGQPRKRVGSCTRADVKVIIDTRKKHVEAVEVFIAKWEKVDRIMEERNLATIDQIKPEWYAA